MTQAPATTRAAISAGAMATNPDDRYDSARALAIDVTKWLDDEPVMAYQEPVSARAGRWRRRSRRGTWEIDGIRGGIRLAA